MITKLQQTQVMLEKKHVEEIPEYILVMFEEWITTRCRARGTKAVWLDLPLTESRIITGWLPEEVVDLICAVRIGSKQAIEDIVTKEYT